MNARIEQWGVTVMCGHNAYINSEKNVDLIGHRNKVEAAYGAQAFAAKNLKNGSLQKKPQHQRQRVRVSMSKKVFTTASSIAAPIFSYTYTNGIALLWIQMSKMPATRLYKAQMDDKLPYLRLFLGDKKIEKPVCQLNRHMRFPTMAAWGRGRMASLKNVYPLSLCHRGK